MRKNLKYSVIIISLLISMVFLPSCKDFLNPDQDLNITKDKLYDDSYEYRSIDMGLYGLQQKLVEQLVVLGELRGDLLTVTPNADADLMEIYNFQPSKTNKYASPTNFYKLISACNSFIVELKTNHPEVTDKKNIETTNYDKLYGEALCMRAWAYFNAVRIYGKIPVIYESLTSVEEIEKYMNSATTYIDTNKIYATDGYNFTIKIDTLKKQYYNIDQVITDYTTQLEQDVKAVGVNNYIDNNDNTWEVSVWNTFAWHALLGQMYLTSGDLIKAANHLNKIAFATSDNYRYQLDMSFAGGAWQNIFRSIDNREHILTLKFNKSNQEQNDFQRLFEKRSPHQYMLKPSKRAILLWETTWRGFNLMTNQTKPEQTILDKRQRGIPGDFYRGYGVSYEYEKNGIRLPKGYPVYLGLNKGYTADTLASYMGMLFLKMEKDVRTYTSIMEDYDTVVCKYSVGKTTYDQDANFIVYRAGGIQLYLGEIYNRWAYDHNGTVKPYLPDALSYVNDGSIYNVLSNRPQLGVLGRIGYSGTYGVLHADNYNYIQDPFTNEVIPPYVKDLTGNLPGKQLFLEEQILDERARELAFEGERFYDLIRVAKRRNDPSFLAQKVAAKYPSSQRQTIYNYLMDEKNWYINIFN